MHTRALAQRIVDHDMESHAYSEAETGLRNVVLAAVFALGRAVQLGYSSPPEQFDWWTTLRKQGQEHAKAYANLGALPESGEWIAGYYFNDALIRTDIGFERLVRYLTDSYRAGNLESLQSNAISRGLPKEFLVGWSEVRDDVNRLKHREVGGYIRPQLDLDRTHAAVANLVETFVWVVKR